MVPMNTHRVRMYIASLVSERVVPRASVTGI